MRRAGLLNEEIKILSPSITTNEFGEKVQTYSVTYTTRANVEHTSGSRTLMNSEIWHDYKKAFKVRSYVPVSDEDLVLYDGKKYRILTIDNKIKISNEKVLITELVNE